MATYNLNLASSYCQHWGLWEAIREILQNGEDQFTLNNDNEISVVYDEKNQKLLISNKESILERKTLLLGCTSKDDNDNLIGKFGEGYKIALLILTKLNKKIVIKNFMKNEKWTPELKKDPKYENEKVLKGSFFMAKVLVESNRDITLEDFNNYYVKKIDNAIKDNHKFVVNDSEGLNEYVQMYLYKKKVSNIIIFHTGNNADIMIGICDTFGGFKDEKELNEAMLDYSDFVM
jgi:hypothetical protein